MIDLLTRLTLYVCVRIRSGGGGGGGGGGEVKWICFFADVLSYITYPWDLLGNDNKENRRNRNKHKSPNFPNPP